MKIVMFFHNGSLNRGCEAIVRSGAELLRAQQEIEKIALISYNPNSDTLIPNLDEIIDGRDVTIKKYTWDWLVATIQNKIFKSEAYYFKKRHKRIFDQIPNFDVLLSIGGDNYCYGEQPHIYEIDREIKKAGKKLVLWGASIGEEDLSPVKVQDLKTFDLILARETYTYETLISKGIQNVKLVADGAFNMGKEELPLPEGWQVDNTIGFNFSPLVAKKNPAAQEATYRLLEHIFDTTSATIALTPHVIEPGNDDYECMLAYYNKYKSTGRVILLPNHLNAVQYKGYIARMRFFIGARTHATIAAYSNAVPTMVLGYSVKSKGIAFDIFGEEKLVLSLEQIADSTQLIAKFDEMLTEETMLRTILAQRIPYIQSMAQKAAHYLLEL
ncbi:MAG: hypothetical protein RL607_515 [Bacteroidota bacterium]|jgi:polysaccharide pyruvyl transferase WcaK-like protein